MRKVCGETVASGTRYIRFIDLDWRDNPFGSLPAKIIIPKIRFGINIERKWVNFTMFKNIKKYSGALTYIFT